MILSSAYPQRSPIDLRVLLIDTYYWQMQFCLHALQFRNHQRSYELYNIYCELIWVGGSIPLSSCRLIIYQLLFIIFIHVDNTRKQYQYHVIYIKIYLKDLQNLPCDIFVEKTALIYQIGQLQLWNSIRIVYICITTKVSRILLDITLSSRQTCYPLLTKTYCHRKNRYNRLYNWQPYRSLRRRPHGNNCFTVPM